MSLHPPFSSPPNKSVMASNLTKNTFFNKLKIPPLKLASESMPIHDKEKEKEKKNEHLHTLMTSPPLLSSIKKDIHATTTPITPKEGSNPLTSTSSSSNKKAITTTTITPSKLELNALMKQANVSKLKLQRYLVHYGRYPQEYRLLLWRYLLNLPENKVAFHHLYDQPIHPAYLHFLNTFPIKSSSLAFATQKVLSCLAYWSPLFENVSYLPALVFPIVKTCYPDVLTAFELTLTLIFNVGQRWWEYYPNPPIDCLMYADDVLFQLDPQLHAHFHQVGLGPQDYFWPLFQTLFSETLRKEHWWTFMDFLLTYQSIPFFYTFAANLLQSYKSALLKLTSSHHVQRFLTRLHPLSFHLAKLPFTVLPTSLFPNPFTFLPKDMYPLFTGYPTCIVAYESKLYAQIRSEEEAYLRRRHVVKEWLELKERLDLDQQRWERTDWRVNDMLEQWWNTLLSKESEHQTAKEQVHLLERQMESMASHQIADARAKFMEQHQEALEHRNLILTQAALTASMLAERRLKDQSLDQEMKLVKQEWEKRWNELNQARKEMEEVERIRMAKLVEKIETIHELQ